MRFGWQAFRGFEGSGRALGADAVDVNQRRDARAAAAEAAMRRAGQAGIARMGMVEDGRIS